MIQLNLLPDVKLEFIKARRTQRLVIVSSLLVIAACVFVLVVLIGTVFVFQKKNLNDLNGDIGKYTAQLKQTPDLNKVLTVQNQLKALPDMHNQKPAADRVFGYIQQVTPATASISQLNVDYAQHKMTITSSAPALNTLNTFTDTLKFTTYRQSGKHSGEKEPFAFSDVVVSQFNRNTTGATYTITLHFDEAIFDIRNEVTLTVPKIISTRSTTEQPTGLFQAETSESRGN